MKQNLFLVGGFPSMFGYWKFYANKLSPTGWSERQVGVRAHSQHATCNCIRISAGVIAINTRIRKYIIPTQVSPKSYIFTEKNKNKQPR